MFAGYFTARLLRCIAISLSFAKNGVFEVIVTGISTMTIFFVYSFSVAKFTKRH
jgi:hypothetical protein